MLLAVGTYAQTDVWRTDSLQEVVVTGTGTRHLMKDAPVQTEVITNKMLSQYGGKSLEDILAGLTASFAFNEGDMGSQMQLNGLGNNYILILIDGKRIHGDVGGENDLSLIDPHNIEKIEIVKGAQSALYGSDAMAGVINIITKKHTEHHHQEAHREGSLCRQRHPLWFPQRPATAQHAGFPYRQGEQSDQLPAAAKRRLAEHT